MQRILFLEHNTDGTIGGSHYCLLEICRTLDRSRYQPVVWFFERNPLLDDFRAADAEVIIEAPPRRFHFRRSGAWPLALIQKTAQSACNALQTLLFNVLRWRRVLRECRIDVVHLNNSSDTDNDLVLAALTLGIPCIAHQRGFPTQLRGIAKRIASHLDAIIAISGSIRDSLIGQGIPADRVLLVHDGIDPERMRAHREASGLREQHGIEADAPVIGMIGNVKEWKGQEVMVRAMREIVTTHPQAHCLIVGAIADPAYRARLEKLIVELGLSSNVRFLGYQRYPAALMAQMDLIVHASIEPEPFGIVILEAMSLAKPVIASRLGGPTDIVLDGITGFLTQAGDPTALSARVCELLSDRQLAATLARAGYQRFLDQFTSQINIAHLQEIYARLAKRSNSQTGSRIWSGRCR